ncbi:MAG: hypothetical protein HRU75_13730 [Planctomycetia bacterium]|nr:MAG: hypothetical protein HRU75_13730 [Planctomycetia bacterium]
MTRRLPLYRRIVLGLSTATLLQTGACSLNALELDQLQTETTRISSVVIGNLFANTVGFFLNNAIVRAVG